MRVPEALRAPRNVLELFVIANLAFLAVDVSVAHEVNAFERRAEWIPVCFSLVAPLLLIVAAAAPRLRAAVGLLVGWSSLVVGISGMLYHLQSHFFGEETLRNLVYTAPFVAPLAYAGLGLLLIMDRMTEPVSLEWAQWVIFLAFGGFVGNFVLSLADHAQNGFFNALEWLPVGAAAAGCAFLGVLVVRPLDQMLQRAAAWLLAVEVAIGLAGFGLHVRGDLTAPSPALWDRFLYGAPVFAPLLFANLSLLAALGMWASRRAAGVLKS